MKNKEKIFFGVMIILFIFSVGLFYYHNFYTNIQSERNKVPVLIATEDIDKGHKLTEENSSWEMIDASNQIEDNNITEDDIENSVTTSKIYKNEVINKNRLNGSERETKYNSYIINIHPDFSYSVKPGDLIRVYSQSTNKDGMIKNNLIFDMKEIVAVSPPQTNSNLETLAIEVTDKDVISYYNAKQLGKIIILKYTNVSYESDLEIPLIDINNNEIDASDGEIDASDNEIDASDGEIDASDGEIDASDGEVSISDN